MTSFLRTLLIATALLTSGALQTAAAIGDDACCEDAGEEKGAPCSDCPLGVVCGCCPIRGAVEASSPAIAPETSPGVVVVLAAALPNVHASATDFFHPPRS